MTRPAPSSEADANASTFHPRPAMASDLAVVARWVTNQAEIERWTGPRYRYPDDLADLNAFFGVGTNDAHVLVADGAVVAFGQMQWRGADRLHLMRIITVPQRRREGLGGKLVAHLLERARRLGARVVTLNVRPGNDDALRLYLRLGFEVGERPATDAPLPSAFLVYRC